MQGDDASLGVLTEHLKASDAQHKASGGGASAAQHGAAGWVVEPGMGPVQEAWRGQQGQHELQGGTLKQWYC